jgi:subtilisin
VVKAVARGVVVTAAAGNEGLDASTSSPANCPDAITVSAIADSNGLAGGGEAATSYGADHTFARFSNFGPLVDIAAPGVAILSTAPGGGYAT